jgi:hypothetical protein
MVENSSRSSGDTVRLTDRISLGVLMRLFPRDLVDEVVLECGVKEQRSRLLPAHVVVYYVLALGLYFGEAYEEVMRRLIGGLLFLRNWSPEWKVPTTSAISQARARLGSAPLEELFHRVAAPIARPGTRGAWYRTWRVMAVDGVILDVPDTPENNKEFDHSSSGKSASAFPVVRVVGLGECGTHAIVGAVVGTWSTGERTLAMELMPDLQPGQLVIWDAGFFSESLYRAAVARGADVLFRVSSSLSLPVLEIYPDGSYRSVLLAADVKNHTRKRARRQARPGDGRHGNLSILEEAGIPCRVFEYRIPNRGEKDEIFRMVTSILDYEDAPALELAALYHERWEFENSLDEIEIHQTGGHRVLRSKSPEMVMQELWGILLAHYAIRHLMHEAADTIEIDPDRISFIRSLRLVRRQITGQATFPPSSVLRDVEDGDR